MRHTALARACVSVYVCVCVRVCVALILPMSYPERMANHQAGGAAPTAGVSHSQPPALSRSTSPAMVVGSSIEEESEDESGDQLSGEAAQGQEQRLLRAEEDRIRKAFRPLHKCVLCRQHRGNAMHATLGAGQWLANTPAPILPPPLCRRLLSSGMFRLETEQWHALLPPEDSRQRAGQRLLHGQRQEKVCCGPLGADAR